MWSWITSEVRELQGFVVGRELGEPSWHLLQGQGLPSSLLDRLTLIYSRGPQTCSVKSQLVNIFGFVGHTVCVATTQLFGS